MATMFQDAAQSHNGNGQSQKTDQSQHGLAIILPSQVVFGRIKRKFNTANTLNMGWVAQSV